MMLEIEIGIRLCVALSMFNVTLIIVASILANAIVNRAKVKALTEKLPEEFKNAWSRATLRAKVLTVDNRRRKAKVCSSCGAKMIRRLTGISQPTMPPQHEWEWWCGCDHIEKGGMEKTVTGDALDRIEWELINEKEEK